MKAVTVFRGLMAFLTSIPVKMDMSFLDIAARYTVGLAHALP